MMMRERARVCVLRGGGAACCKTSPRPFFVDNGNAGRGSMRLTTHLQKTKAKRPAVSTCRREKGERGECAHRGAASLPTSPLSLSPLHGVASPPLACTPPPPPPPAGGCCCSAPPAPTCPNSAAHQAAASSGVRSRHSGWVARPAAAAAAAASAPSLNRTVRADRQSHRSFQELEQSSTSPCR